MESYQRDLTEHSMDIFIDLHDEENNKNEILSSHKKIKKLKVDYIGYWISNFNYNFPLNLIKFSLILRMSF